MISLNNITVQFNGIALFENITFKVNPKNRIGLTSRNEAGKSTMLKLIDNQKTGFLVEKNNIEETVNKIMLLESDNELRQKMGREGEKKSS